MRVDALHYELPPELIAQRPTADREHARLMHVPPGGADFEHLRIGDLPELIPPGALVVVNDTRVLPARLLGKKRDTGGKVEVFLLKQVESRAIEVAPGELRFAPVWRALGKSTKPLRFGTDVEVPPRPRAPPGSPSLRVRLLGRAEDGLLEVALLARPEGADAAGAGDDLALDAAIRACGHVPLPPYIKRDDALEDADRYQTVYARHDGAVAAPTAGLHLTQALLDRLTSRGCEIAPVTLHVGLGTFQPVTVQNLDDHPMHAEEAIVPPATVEAVDRARARGAPVVAIGTTTTRALESAGDPDHPGRIRALAGPTRLLIQPGYAWRVVDAMLTNFHLPGSTLLAMVCAFVGVERVLDAYRVAVAERYRFFSYGDAMLLARRR